MLHVRDIMTSDVVTLTPDASIREAMELLSARHLSSAPVLSGQTVTGIISMSDIVDFIITSPDAAVGEPAVDSWSEAGAVREDEVSEEGLPDDTWEEWPQDDTDARLDDGAREGDALLDQHTVEEAMTEGAIGIPSGASIRQAATAMRKHGVHRVLVMEGKKLVGIVSALDIARAVSEKKVRDGVPFELGNPAPAVWTAV